MANPDRPRGLTPVRHANGGSWNNALAEIAVPDDATIDEDATWGAIFIGDPVVLSGTNALAGKLGHLPMVAPLIDEQDEAGTDLIYGVVVGIGRPGETQDGSNEFGMFNPDSLTTNYITGAEVEADTDGFVLYVAPAADWIFEAQTSTLELCRVGTGLDTSITAATVAHGNTSTGRSTVELTNDETGDQFTVVAVPEYVDNDAELINARVHVMAKRDLTVNAT